MHDYFLCLALFLVIEGPSWRVLQDWSSWWIRSRELIAVQPQLDILLFLFIVVLVVELSKHLPPVSDTLCKKWIHGSFRHTMTPRKSILRVANGSDCLPSLRASRIVSGAHFCERIRVLLPTKLFRWYERANLSGSCFTIDTFSKR